MIDKRQAVRDKILDKQNSENQLRDKTYHNEGQQNKSTWKIPYKIYRVYSAFAHFERTASSQCCQTEKFDPFLSLDCARVEDVGAQSKEKKGSNFAA